MQSLRYLITVCGCMVPVVRQNDNLLMRNQGYCTLSPNVQSVSGTAHCRLSKVKPVLLHMSQNVQLVCVTAICLLMCNLYSYCTLYPEVQPVSVTAVCLLMCSL